MVTYILKDLLGIRIVWYNIIYIYIYICLFYFRCLIQVFLYCQLEEQELRLIHQDKYRDMYNKSRQIPQSWPFLMSTVRIPPLKNTLIHISLFLLK